MNLSKEKRERLLNYLEKLKENKEDEDIRIISEIENALNEKKYGLVWEEHSEKVDEDLKTKIPLFTEVKDRRIEKDKEKPYNFLLEGDNLHSLKLLQKTHKGKIDVIYIDPPYNTGNKDFIYNDQYVDKTDGYSHSKWLSFMEKRLRIARELLTEEGVIFISIDDNEQAQLKLLCDEVFGGENFVNSISVKMSESTGVKMTHVGKRLPKLKEYILFYSKRIINLKLNEIKIPKDKWDDEYKILIEGVTKQELDEIKKIINAESVTIEDIQNLDDICRKIRFSNISKLLNKVQNNDKLNILYENSYRIVRDVATSDGDKKIADSKRLEHNICEGAFLIKTAKNKGYLIRGDYSPVSKQPRMKLLFADQYLDIKIGDFWEDIKTTGLGNEGEVNLLNGKKPLKLLDRLLKLSSCKNSTILDFFAGFRVIIVIEANSYVNTRSSRLLPKFKTQKINGWCAA